MAPKTRASAKSKRVAQVAAANARLHGRRGALRVLNGVVTSLQFESLCVNVKEQAAIPMLEPSTNKQMRVFHFHHHVTYAVLPTCESVTNFVSSPVIFS
jgi:hypothetical protein